MEISLMRIVALVSIFVCVFGTEVMLKYVIGKKSERNKKREKDHE